MSWALFIDESGQDRRESPYEVLAGIAVEDRKIWPLIRQLSDAQQHHFGMRLFEAYGKEAKAQKLLDRRTFRFAAQGEEIELTRRATLAKELLTNGDAVSRQRLTALGQAKVAYAKFALGLARSHGAKAFASIVPRDAPRPDRSTSLRKDYSYLFERFYEFLNGENGGPMGYLIFDEFDRSASHVLLNQVGSYFIKTANGRTRSRLIIPEPFFVHSDLTTLVQVADIIAYAIAWGLRLNGMTEPARAELSEIASCAAAMEFDPLWQHHYFSLQHRKIGRIRGLQASHSHTRDAHMSLRMPGPTLINTVYHLNQRTPGDLGHLIGRKIQLPVAGVARTVTVRDVVRLSLRTREPKVAKARHAEADRALRKIWDAARAARVEPHVVQIAGCDPYWMGEAAAPAPAARTKDSYAPEHRALTDILRENGVEPSAKNVQVLLNEHAGIMAAAVPDWAGRYRLTLLDVWERWVAANKDLVKPSTVIRYTPSIQRLAAFVGDKDVRSITSDDVYAWAVHRRDDELIDPRTINNNDLAAVGSVLRWATTREGGRILATAPMDDVKVPEGKRNEGRRFRDEEVTAILLASLRVEVDPRNPTQSYAFRWTPWLAGYSGARIGELSALTGSEIHLVDQVWAMHFPETKTNEARTVPIHDHLVEMGFIDFAKSRGAAPLFYDPARHTRENPRTSPSDNRAQKIANWVRDVARLPDDVDPNHGWRHTFKSRAAPYIDQRMRDAITGHAPSTIGRKYEKFSTRELATALKAFPRYDIEADQD